MTVYEFARVISIDPSTLNRWWSQRRFAVKLMVAGYRSVVRNLAVDPLGIRKAE
tara:strand:+ start:198 stop:359 length:162 start_codon:yes stop_codon:yes gene_type:complete